MTKDTIEFLYKKYVQRMKKFLPGQERMPRKVFKVLVDQYDTLAEGEVTLEKYFELLLTQLLEDKKVTDETSNTGESIQGE